jgi:hypothetical protein
MKYKLLGIANIFVACMEILIMVNLLMVREKLESMYNSLKVDLPLVTRFFPFLAIFMIIAMVFVFVIGVKLFRNKTTNDKLFTFGAVVLVCTVILLFVLIGFSVMSIVMPIYTLTESL